MVDFVRSLTLLRYMKCSVLPVYFLYYFTAGLLFSSVKCTAFYFTAGELFPSVKCTAFYFTAGELFYSPNR